MRELRAITFTPTEVIQAILLLAQRTREKLPTGQISGVRFFEDDDAPYAKLAIVDDYGETTQLERSGAELAAALVAYCIDRRVRLPASGNKFVEIVNRDLTLFIVLEGKVGTRANALTRPRHDEVRRRLEAAETAAATRR